MNTLAAQTDILSRLANIVHQSAGTGYELAIGEFSVLDASTRSTFYTVHNGERKYLERKDPKLDSLYKVLELHALMKSHTGGVWESLTLTIDKDGKVTTKFHYPDAGAPPIDA